ncbi:hypothetical protein B0H34DRAFT_709390 [Crassisporium funariophilum]|nr:hypothetical protein B0H34DRAFT_709390 [Crassisporium funariophilum]
MTSSDRGYTILLSHLHNPGTNLPLSTIQGALAHQLATVSPLPTPLAATAVSCPLYLTQPFTHTKLQSLSTAFRHATHLKYRAQVDAEKTRTKVGSLFGRSIQGNIGQWVTDTLKGVQGGNSVLRLACCSGLLLGVEDLKIGERSEKKEGIDVGRARSGVEDETVVALAEVMDAYGYGFASNPSSVVVEEWEKEFQPAGQDILSLALILASQSLPLVPQHKLKALPLPILARLLTSTINSTFKSGSFLSSVSASVTLSPQHQVHISPSSPLAQTLQSMTSSPLTTSIASISRLTANVLALLLDLPTSSRLEEGIFTISETLDSLNETAKQVEHDWIACPLASATDSEIDPGSKDLTKLIWTTLKTMLFSTIMLAEAILSSIVFVPPRFSHITPATLALQILHTLSHLSFIISEFGGVTTTTQGFEQLKKTFYLALDILAQGDGEQGDSGMQAESYVQKVCFSLNSQRTENAATSPRQAKQAFVLASIEQLVPVLSDKCIRDWVWGVCYPHLSDPSHRDTYESAHSVVLSIFASHAQRQHQQHPGNRTSALTQVSTMTTISNAIGKRWSLVDQRRTTTTPSSGMMNSGGEDKTVGPEGVKFSSSNTTSEEAAVSATFVKRMVPFYAQCLIEVSILTFLAPCILRIRLLSHVLKANASNVCDCSNWPLIRRGESFGFFFSSTYRYFQLRHIFHPTRSQEVRQADIYFISHRTPWMGSSARPNSALPTQLW